MGEDALSGMPDQADPMVRVSYHNRAGRLLWKFCNSGKSRVTVLVISFERQSGAWSARFRLPYVVQRWLC